MKATIVAGVVGLLAATASSLSLLPPGHAEQATSGLKAHPLLSLSEYQQPRSSAATGALPLPAHSFTVTSGSPEGYIPCDLQRAYYLNGVSSSGAGETIAIIDAFAQPNIESDLLQFDSTFGLPAPPAFKIVPMAKNLPYSESWGLETSLDVEWAHALAPAATIDLVEASSDSLSNLLTAVHQAVSSLHADVVSMGWGVAEFASESKYDKYFPLDAGAIFLASAGDYGAGATWPAASPNVIGVGGTSLGEAATGDTTASHSVCAVGGTGASPANQTAWGSSGGGPSTFEPEPLYQSSVVTEETGARGVPDVAWDADPATGVAVFDSYGYLGHTGWFEVGGTSVGAPSWAAIVALADQSRSSQDERPLSISKSLGDSPVYSAYSVNSSGFTDVQSGSNGSCGTACTSVSGYDLLTGLGTPVGSSLLATPGF